MTTPDIESGKRNRKRGNGSIQNDSSEAADVSVKQTVYEKGSDVPAAEAKDKGTECCSGAETARGQCHRCRPKALGYGKSNLYTVKTEKFMLEIP